MADSYSERQATARRAFGDATQSSIMHGKQMEMFNVEMRRNGAMCHRTLVLSSLLGLCTAAATTAAAAASPRVLSALRANASLPRLFVWATAGGCALAFLATRCFDLERSVYDIELSRELWEIDNDLNGELREMLAIYKSQGLSEEEALVVTRIFARRKRVFANLMMVEELGYSRLDPATSREALLYAGVPAALGYVAGATLPLVLLVHGNDAVAAAVTASISSSSSSGGVAHTLTAATPLSCMLRLPSANAVRVVVLTSVGVVLSYLQVEVFYGAYSCARRVAEAVAVNALGIGAVSALSYCAARFC